MCIEVFEHLPEPIAAIKEFSRLLKPNGKLIITVPFASLTHFAPYHFYSGFNRYFFEHFLPLNNFEIIELSPNGNYFDYLAQELWRLPEIASRYAGKSKNFFQKLLIFLTVWLLSSYKKKGYRKRGVIMLWLPYISSKKR
jgi:SAM-dependent methyltransferase